MLGASQPLTCLDLVRFDFMGSLRTGVLEAEAKLPGSSVDGWDFG